jgi:hypothetical protein
LSFGYIEKMFSFIRYVHICIIVLSVYVYTRLSIYPTTPTKTIMIVYLILLSVAVIHDDKPTFASAEFRNKDYLHLYKVLRKMYVVFEMTGYECYTLFSLLVTVQFSFFSVS